MPWTNRQKACTFRHTMKIAAQVHLPPVNRILLRYLIRGTNIKRILAELAALIRVRIVFYDINDIRLEQLAGYPDYKYCRQLGRSADFDRRCVTCGQVHIAKVRKRRSIEVYRCHHGLLEGIVPLFDTTKTYLGCLMFGQIREPGRPCGTGRGMAALYRQLPCYCLSDVRRIARLLKLLGEYIVENHLIRLEQKVWSRRLQHFIIENLTHPPTLNKCAKATGCSPSFISHNVKREFGCSLHQYVRLLRMEQARHLLADGMQVKAVAASLGFHDSFHFSRVFKQTFGKSPIHIYPRNLGLT